MSLELHAARAKRPALETHLKRFDKSHRKRLRKLAKTSPRLGDLLFSFPGAAFALVSGHGSPQNRGAAIARVKEGAGLKEVAAALGLPLWLRRAPPEAFRRPLPEAVDRGEVFGRKVVNLLPDQVAATPLWLELTLEARAIGDETFGLWIADQTALRRPQVAERCLEIAAPSLALVALYAWVSKRPELLAHRFIEVAWRKQMRLGQAVEQTRIWLERVVGEYCRPHQRARDGMWLATQRVSGFSFAPRLTARELEAEGRAMANCVGGYADKVAKGGCLIYAIRRGGRSVATLEIVGDGRGGGRIAQLEGYANGPPPDKVVGAVNTWLRRLGPCPVGRKGLLSQNVDPARWAKLWGPIWTERGLDCGAPEQVDEATFRAADQELAALMQIARL